MTEYNTHKNYYCKHLCKNYEFVSQCTPLNEMITYIWLLRKNNFTVLPQIAHLKEIVLLKGHFLVKLSLIYLTINAYNYLC